MAEVIFVVPAKSAFRQVQLKFPLTRFRVPRQVRIVARRDCFRVADNTPGTLRLCDERIALLATIESQLPTSPWLGIYSYSWPSNRLCTRRGVGRIRGTNWL